MIKWLVGLKDLAEALVFEPDGTINDSIVGHSLCRRYRRHSLINRCFMRLRRVWNVSPQDGIAEHLIGNEQEPMHVVAQRLPRPKRARE